MSRHLICGVLVVADGFQNRRPQAAVEEYSMAMCPHGSDDLLGVLLQIQK